MPLGKVRADMRSSLRARQRALTCVLLCLWLITSFVAPYFARELSISVGGWPLHFWLASQGSLLVFLAIVVVYAWLMNRWEAQEMATPDISEPDSSGH